MSDAQVVLEAENIRKNFYFPSKVEVLKGVSLSVRCGESVAIMGASGEGKSTLLHILGTLEQPCAGSLKIHGVSAMFSNRAWLRNKAVGFVFQSFHLLEDFSLLENVLMPVNIARIPIHKGSIAYLSAQALLEKVGLGARMHFPVKLLSGGERQRAAIARALINDPALILADEPSGNLDHNTAREVSKVLFDSVRSLGKALVVVTHDHAFAEQCSKRYQLDNGVLLKV